MQIQLSTTAGVEYTFSVNEESDAEASGNSRKSYALGATHLSEGITGPIPTQLSILMVPRRPYIPISIERETVPVPSGNCDDML